MGMSGYFLAVTPAQLEAVMTDSETFMAVIDSEDEKPLDIDKAWHGIHFLLTGEAWSNKGPVLGGTEIAGIDLGSGAARYLSPEQVDKMADELSQLSPEKLSQRFDTKEFGIEGIYPDIWEHDGELDWLLHWYRQLQSYYANASEAGKAMLLWIM
jgi:hypothetical protein